MCAHISFPLPPIIQRYLFNLGGIQLVQDNLTLLFNSQEQRGKVGDGGEDGTKREAEGGADVRQGGGVQSCMSTSYLGEED